MKRLILSADNRSVYSGHEGHWTYCVGLTELYAKAHNIEFQCIKIQKETTGRHIAWTKIPLIRKFIDIYDEILWLDTDATVINMSVDVFDYIKSAPKAPTWPTPNVNAVASPLAYMVCEKGSSDVNPGIALFNCRNKAAIRDLLNDWWNDIPHQKYEQESPWDSSVVNTVWKTNPQKAHRIQVADIWSTAYMSEDQVFIHIDSRYKDIRLHEAKRFFYKQIKPRTKKIGIYVRQQNYYSNGAGQNTIFLRHSFEALGYQVDFLVTYDKTKPARVADNIPYMYIDSKTVDYSQYELVLYGSKIAPYDEQQTMRKLGVRTVMFSPCASFDALHNESFIHPSKPDTVPLFESTFKDCANEIWHLDNHWDTTAKYIETLNQNKIPIREMKITWSPMFILNNSKASLYIQPSDCKTLDIVIMEPNSGYAKSAWIPLVICEHLYQTFPSILNKVYLFNKPQEGTQAMQMIHRLSIWKDKKLRLLNRIPINDMLDFFSDTRKHGNNHVAFLSHQINVPLNYAYFDTMYSGFPLVHNSHMLNHEKQGSYYETVEQGMTALINTMTQNIDVTMVSSRDYLETRNPYNKAILESFETLMIPSNNNNLPLLTITEYPAPAPVQAPAPAPTLQVVVLYCKEDRKIFQEQQFKDIPLPWPVTFFPAFTPENSKEYINEKHPTMPEEDGLICCMRSHAAALNWYVKTQKSTQYLLILEDDVALLKDGFVEKVNQSIALWEKHTEDIDFLSLGYFPKANFKGNKADGILHWDIKQGNYVWGTQAILVNATSAVNMARLFHHTTTKFLYSVLEKREKYQNRVTRLSPDVLYPTFFRQGVVLPTLTMEGDFRSNILQIHSQTRWEPFIKEHLINPRQYYSDPFAAYTPVVNYKIQLVFICVNEERKSFQQKQMADLNIPWPVHFFQAYTRMNLDEWNDVAGSGEDEGHLCCTRSFGGALGWFAEHSKDIDYLLLLEDDAVFIKEKFVEKVHDTIKLWKKHESDIDYVNLGYRPRKEGNLGVKTDCSLTWDYSNGVHVWGCQGQLIKTEHALRMANILNQPKASLVRTAVQQHPHRYQSRHLYIQSDALFPSLFKQGLIIPPIIIEGDFRSVLAPWSTNVTSWKYAIDAKFIDPSLFYKTPFLIDQTIHVVIMCGDDTRKKFQEKQLYTDLKLPWPITFFPAFTPTNSQGYMVDRDPVHPEIDGTLCCMRTRAAIVNWYIQTHKDKPYLLILEDDVALLKEGFVEKVKQAVSLWDKHKQDIDYVSLGYFPKENLTGKQSDGCLHWDFSVENYVYGHQAAIISYTSACKMAELFHQPTTKALRTALKDKHKYQNRIVRIQSDALFPTYFRQAIVIPTLTMEADFKSIITEKNHNYYSRQRWEDRIRNGVINPHLYYTEPFADILPGYVPILRTINNDTTTKRMTTNAYTICLQKDDTSQIGRYLVFLMNTLNAKGINVYPIYGNETDNTEVFYKSCGIIIGSRIPSENELVLNKSMKLPLIYVFATNPTVDDVERFSYTTTSPVERMDIIRSCNKIWLAHHHKQHESYIKTIYKLPVSIIPNVWSNSLSSIELTYTSKDPSTQLEIVLLDMNTTFNTSGWKSLVICEQLHLQQPNLLSKVYMFNTPDSNKTSMDMIHSLTLMKQGKVRIFKSLPIKDIVSFFLSSKQNVAFLSNQIFDDMSYDFYDALYSGFPLIHSSKLLKDANIGRYYDSLDIQGAINQLQVKDYDVQANVTKNRHYLSTLTITDTATFQ